MAGGPHAFRRVTTVDALVTAISDAILAGSYAPGEWFREEELAADYGVSRHTLRAALAQMVQQGLLRREPHRGVFVPRLTRDDIADIYRARAVFELDAARALTARGVLGFDPGAVLTPFERLLENSPWREVVEVDVIFHTALIDAIGSPRISALYANLLSEFRLCILHTPIPDDYPSLVVDKHRTLINVLQSDDPERAVAHFRAHLDDSEQRLLAKYGEPLAAVSMTG